MLLDHLKVIWYHQGENRTEFMQQSNWGGYFGTCEFASGYVGNCISYKGLTCTPDGQPGTYALYPSGFASLDRHSIAIVSWLALVNGCKVHYDASLEANKNGFVQLSRSASDTGYVYLQVSGAQHQFPNDLGTLDDDWHFMALHVEYLGGNTWSGSYSIDGASWSGLGTVSAPLFEYSSARVVGMYGRFNIDEAALWWGVERFTDEELGNLYSLASGSVWVDRKTLNDYSSQFPFSASGQADLSIEGGEGAAAASRWPVAELLRTHDHHPQVIGLLGYVGVSGDVEMTVYELTGMTEVALGHSGCYPIGDTGRWGWSTAYLPAGTSHGQHFVYRMATSGGAQTFAGEFLLRFPESKRR